MEINRLRYLLKDVIRIGLLIAIVGLGIWGVYQFFTRDNDIFGQLPAPYFQDILTQNPAWDANNYSLDAPAQEVVFQVKNRSITREQAWALADKLKLPQAGTITLEQNSQEQYYTKNTQAELLINLTTGKVHYKNSGATASANGVVNKNSATEEAKKLIVSLGIATSTYDLIQPSYEFLQAGTGSNHLIETTESKANIIYVAYPREIDGVAVAGVGGVDALVVGLNNHNQIISLNYSNLEIETPSEASYKLISSGAAKDRLLDGKGRLNRYLVDAEEAAANPMFIKIGAGRVNFYNDGQTAFIQPIYVFKGVAQSPGAVEEVEIYLPAIKDSYYQD